MRTRLAMRRLAVLQDGQFVGMIAVDDLLIDLASDLADLARPVTAEVLWGHNDSPVPAGPLPASMISGATRGR
jgi:hypothetical protein